jgi:inorganic pyrophosphatase
MANKNGNRGLADPISIKPFGKDDDQVKVIVETPKDSNNKYAFDPEERIFTLKTVLPAGMSFPYDFGFVPRTEAEDGDPLDVLIFMDQPAYPGVLLKCRLIGLIEGEQTEKNGKTVRNDRLLAVEQGSHTYAHLKHVKDVPQKLLDELGEFFANYHKLEGSKYTTLGIKGPGGARKKLADTKAAP